MDSEQLLGRYARLRDELAQAYAAPTRRMGRIERLVEELADTERALADSEPRDEQTNDAFPAFATR